MPLISCTECAHQVSTTAKECPSCGAKVPRSRALLIALLSLPVIFLVWAITRTPSPDEFRLSRDRDVIRQCWKDQEAKSNTASHAQSIAAMCERFESDFKGKYGRNP